MRAVRNLVAPPIVIITDSKEFAFNFPTRFRVDVSMRGVKFLCIKIKAKKVSDGFSSRQGRLCVSKKKLMEIYEAKNDKEVKMLKTNFPPVE